MVMVRLGSSPRSKQLSASGGDMVNCGKRLRPRELEPPCDLAFPLLFTTSSFGHPTSSTALSLSLLACSLMTQRAPTPCIIQLLAHGLAPHPLALVALMSIAPSSTRFVW